MKTQGSSTDVVFLSGVRTGFGAFGGTLKDLSAIELGAIAARHALERSRVPAGQIGHSIFGNALQTSADAIYCARHIGLKAGLPIEVPAVTVNRLCGSGFEAITQGAQLIMLGEANAVLAGGTESEPGAACRTRARWGIRLAPPRPSRTCCGSLRDPQCAFRWPKRRASRERYTLTRNEVADEGRAHSPASREQAGMHAYSRDEVVPVPVKGKG